MLNAVFGGLGVAIPFLIVAAIGYGRLQQTVKSQPELMRVQMKLAIKEGLEQHIEKYRHEQIGNTGVRAMGHPEDATG